jgi:hypothetical protein
MELIREHGTNTGFAELNNDEMMMVSGGMAPAVIYALGFMFACAPVYVVAAAVVCVVAIGIGIAVS